MIRPVMMENTKYWFCRWSICLKLEFAEKVRAFVENGGTLITSYWSGITDDTDRCYLEGTPHGLMDVLGIRSTEIDGLYDWEENTFVPLEGNELGLTETYTCKYLCDLVELRGAKSDGLRKRFLCGI